MIKKIERLRSLYPQAKICTKVEVNYTKNEKEYFLIDIEIYLDTERGMLVKHQVISFDQTHLNKDTAEAIDFCLGLAGFGQETAQEPEVEQCFDVKGKKSAEKEVKETDNGQTILSFETLQKSEIKKKEEKPSESAACSDEPEIELESEKCEFSVHTMEDAKRYQVTSGCHKGKYIGELLAIDKKAVEFFATKYRGSDANLRVAARIALGFDKAVDF